MRFLLVLMIWLSAAVSAAAQDSDLVTLSSVQDGRGWEAVGRLNIAGKGFCTAALIREDLILTAAHCVFDTNGEEIGPERFQFVAGLREGRAEAYRGVRLVEPHSDYQSSVGTETDNVSHDLAVLQLDQPIRRTNIHPFPVANTVAYGDTVGVVSYARGRENSPSLQEVCDVLGFQEGVVVMTCEVNFGASGSPVFRIRQGRPEIVSVVSAMADLDGDPVSLGVSLNQSLTDLLYRFDRTANERRLPTSITVGERASGGAKFVRP